MGESPQAANHVRVKEDVNVALLIPVHPKAVNGNHLYFHVFRMFKGEERLATYTGPSQSTTTTDQHLLLHLQYRQASSS